MYKDPRFYSLAKIHKPGIPIRSVIAFYDAPHYNLSTFLANLIQKILETTEFFNKDSWHFKSKIDNVVMPNNNKIISLDIESVYTSIHHILIINCIQMNSNDIS